MEIKTLELSQLIIVSKLSYLLTALFAKQILVITYITSLFPLQSSRVSLLSFPLDQVGSASSVESVATSCHPPIQLVTCRYLGNAWVCGNVVEQPRWWDFLIPLHAVFVRRPHAAAGQQWVKWPSPATRFLVQPKPTSCLSITVAQTDSLTSHACPPGINFIHQPHNMRTFCRNNFLLLFLVDGSQNL